MGATQAQTVQSIGSVASAAATATIAATSAASIAAGGTGLILGLTASAAIPIVGAVIAGITIGITAILNSGCGQLCIVTSNWANQAEDLLKQNIAGYFNLPAPRTVEQKAQALANFDNIWNYLYQQCANPQLGVPGSNCINDRKAGACKWHVTTPNLWPGQPGPGECFNWFNGYRDPIANDPAVVSGVTDSLLSGASSGTSTSDLLGSLFGNTDDPTGPGSMLPLLAGTALILVALVGGK